MSTTMNAGLLADIEESMRSVAYQAVAGEAWAVEAPEQDKAQRCQRAFGHLEQAYAELTDHETASDFAEYCERRAVQLVHGD